MDVAGGTIKRQVQLVSTTSPVLVTDPLRSPIERLKPTIADPRLRVEAEAVQELVRDGAAPLKHEMETAAEAAAAMLLTALRVEESYAGHYQLGRSALYTKKLEAAVQHFERALALRPGAPEATNALAVTRAHQGDRAAALEMSRALADSAPDFAPVHYNVAWWLTEAGEMRQAAVYYQKAQQLGLVDANLEKRLHGAP